MRDPSAAPTLRFDANPLGDSPKSDTAWCSSPTVAVMGAGRHCRRHVVGGDTVTTVNLVDGAGFLLREAATGQPEV